MQKRRTNVWVRACVNSNFHFRLRKDAQKKLVVEPTTTILLTTITTTLTTRAASTTLLSITT